MEISKRIQLGKRIFFAVVEVEYKKTMIYSSYLKKEKEYEWLFYKNQDNYYDDHDMEYDIEELEKNYNEDTHKKYNLPNFYMANIIYIYENIPHLKGVRDVFVIKGETLPYSMGYISREEIEKYIKDNKIKIKNQRN